MKKETYGNNLEDQLERGGFSETLKAGIRILLEMGEWDSPIIEVSPRKIGKKERGARIKVFVGGQTLYFLLSLKRFEAFEPGPSLIYEVDTFPKEYPVRMATKVFRNIVGDAIAKELKKGV